MNYGFVVLVAFCCFAMAYSALTCTYDRDCKSVVCTILGEVPECHRSTSDPTIFECHCHIPNECKKDADCVADCGPNATCDKKACHGDCSHD